MDKETNRWAAEAVRSVIARCLASAALALETQATGLRAALAQLVSTR